MQEIISIPNTTPPSGLCLPRQRAIKICYSFWCVAHIRLRNPSVVKVLIALPFHKELFRPSNNSNIHYTLDLKLSLTRLDLYILFPIDLPYNCLQLAYVENIMDPPVTWKLQPVCYWANTLQYLKRTCPNRC